MKYSKLHFSHILKHFDSLNFVIGLLVELAGNHIASGAWSLILARIYTHSLLFLKDVGLWSILEPESFGLVVLGSGRLFSWLEAAIFPTLTDGGFWLFFQEAHWIVFVVLGTG